MIIRRITISNWRAIEKFERALELGLNLLKGPNEAGKSSIVEAIGWALHRDLVGGARLKDEIAPIIPAGNPKAKPQVELLLEFSTCSATISKTLAEDSAQRECVLIIRREGVADECFDQGDAQTQLKKLIASDGELQAESTVAALEGELLLSAQGGSTVFVGRELSSAARAAANSVAVGEGGVLAPTSRLEKVRAALEKRKSKELFEKLKTNAVDAAKKQTDAARVRDELHELREAHAKYSTIESQIGALRAVIEKLKAEQAQMVPRVEAEQRELENLRVRHTAQIKADTQVAELRRAHDEAKANRDEWQRRVEEITHWQNELARAGYELQAAHVELETAQSGLAELEAKQNATWQEHQQSEAQIEVTRQKATAWNLAYEVCVSHRERNRVRKRIEQLETAQAELEAAQAAVEGLSKAPNPLQIGQWRRQYSELQSARQVSAHSIQLALRLQHGVSLQWQADGGEVQINDAESDEEFVIGAGQTISVIVPGVGCIEVAGEGSEARKQIGELDAKTRSLESQLKPFGVAWNDLPEALDELEKNSAAEAAARQKLQLAQSQWRSISGAGESLEEARADFEQWDAQWKNAREQFDTVRETLPEGIKEMTALRERDRWRDTESEQRKTLAQAQKKWQIAFAALSAAKSNANQAQARIATFEDTRQRAMQRLSVLQNDDKEDNDSRAHVLDELNTKLYKSKLARDAAIQHREGLGEAVSEETVAFAAHELEYSRNELHRLQTDLAERRMELRGQCEQDPQTELDRLNFEIEIREVEIARHESRLRGVGVLDAAIEAERHRLGRELSTPLNKFLSPWLSELRGKETHLEFDENGGRIVGIRTGENGSTHILPFGSHSGGMQEQTALVLRLLLARLAAQKLPSGRLPIVLDDPLTQTDTLRREGLWRVLRHASENLQILFVTCHEAQLPQGEANHIVLGDWQENSTLVENHEPLVETTVEALSEKIEEKSKPATRKSKREKPVDDSGEVLPLW